MIIKQISILNFKNIEQADLCFSPKMNCLFGNNGMGKTNLLDALYYLSFCKNHTGIQDSQLIQHSKEFAVLQGLYQTEEKEEDIYCAIRYKKKKIFKRNKKEYDKLSEHIGLIPLVMISPSDTDLILGGSEGRRKFVDQVISQYDKSYLHALISYNRALLQRNILLRNEYSDSALYEIWEEQMYINARIIHEKRKRFASEFIPIFKQHYQIICNSTENVNFNYESQLDENDLAELLSQKRDKDKLLGYTTSGIHKDDFVFMLDDYLMRKIGSQGQNKTYLIALKLAQYDLLAKSASISPILLLDDIFDKLDAERVEQIIKLVAQPHFGQIFITDTNRNYLDEILLEMNHDYVLYRVNNGQIIASENEKN